VVGCGVEGAGGIVGELGGGEEDVGEGGLEKEEKEDVGADGRGRGGGGIGWVG
jgi:hypothetical protein